MSKLSYKSLLIIFFFLLISVVVLTKFVLPENKVSAAWWNDGWSYRQAITVANNTSFDAENIPYKINLDTASLITAGKLQTDADDIRIIDSNGKIIRSQVEKDTLNTANTKIWFEATVKSNSASSYYIYYGNSSVTAPTFETNLQTFTNTATTATITMKDGFSYTISTANGGRVTDVKKNSSSLGIAGNIMYSSSYPGNWWNSAAFTQTVLNSSGPLFAEINYGAGTTGSYSAYGTNHKIFNNGFVETQISVTYNASGSENFYYYLSFANGTRNSVWVNNSGTLVDQSANSGSLTESSLGQNWFGQRWTDTGIYGGTIITKNGSDWNNGSTSAQASYYQTNYSYTQAFTSGSSRDVRFGLFVGNGDIAEMQQKGANYGALSSSLASEETGGGPIAYWKFDEGSGSVAHNSISTNHDGNLGGGSTLPVWQNEDQCVSGKCLKFDGVDDYINAGTGANYFPLPTFSTCAWIKTPGLATGMSINGIFSLTYGLSMYLNGSGQFVTYMDDGVNIVGKTVTSTNLHDNKFHHLCLTYDGTNRNMYIDGIQKLSVGSTWLGTTRWPTNGVNIGHENNNSPYYKFNGIIDEVKIYPYARTTSQIKLDYNSRGSSSGSSVNLGVKSSTNPDLSSKLIAYYKFDEGVGTTIYDSSLSKNNGNIGTGNSTPTWQTENQCVFGKCLNFLGGAYMSSRMQAGNTIPLSDTFSISHWIKSSSGGYSVSNAGSGNGYRLGIGGGGRVGFLIGNSGGYTETSCGTKVINDNKWHLITGIYNNTINKFICYIDGKYEAEVTVVNFTGFQTGAPAIGGYSFTGLIDEVKIYNTALTADEVKQDYNQGSAISFGSSTQTIGNTTTSLDYCIPGDTSYCASPIAEWKMDDGAGVSAKDTSGNNLNGTINGATWTQGKIGGALSFDGINDIVSAGNSSILQQTGNYTLESWFKPNNNTAAFFILKNGEYGFKWNGNTSAVNYFDNTYKNSTKTSWNLNQWYHLSMVKIGSTLNFYVNGSLDSTSISAAHNINYNLEFGAWGGVNFFSGQLDQIKIYNYGRTPAQIAYDYNKGGPVGWWKFDECQGDIAYDWSGIGNTGSINIGPSGAQTSVGTCTTSNTAWSNGATGHTNSSLNFDGVDDYMTTTVLPASESFSLSTWFKSETITNGQRIYWGNGTNRAILAYDANEKLQWYVQTTNGSVGYLTSINTVKVNQWNNAILIYNGSNIKLYINGILDPVTGSLTGTSSASGFNFGTNYNHTANWFDGQIDDVRFYNYPLTSEQIKTVYNNGAVNFN